MRYFSTNGHAYVDSLKEAVLQGLAADKGLFMPEEILPLPQDFLDNIHNYSLQEIATEVATHLFGDEIEKDILETIAHEALNFQIPLVEIHPKEVYALELFHGNTLAFKDVGARFMARLLAYFQRNENKETTILAATSGDTGSAVASGFLGVEGMRVVLLYPKNKVSPIQEQQLTTFGGNVTALEVDGTFDDCQALVKQAFLDEELNKKLILTSANSINLARLIPQSFYYFWAVAQLKGEKRLPIFAVPSGNFGNLTAGIIAKKMGLRISRFIAATNINDVVPQYLLNGEFAPRPSIPTISNAMDVGNPSNFARMLELYAHSYARMSADVAGYRLTDRRTKNTLKSLYELNNYLADPHGVIAYAALKNYMNPITEVGIFLETAHPAKFYEVVTQTIPDLTLELPPVLEEAMKKEKQAVAMSKNFADFKAFLMK